MSKMIQLPLSGDLWVAPEYDKEGNIVPRADNVTAPPVKATAGMTQDQMAMLFASIEQAKAAAPAPEK